MVSIVLIHWVEICPVDSAIQRMNYRDISLRGRLQGKKGEGIGEGRKQIPPSFPLHLPPAPPPPPTFLVPGTLYCMQGKVLLVLATYRWCKPGWTSIPSRGLGGDAIILLSSSSYKIQVKVSP